MDVERLRTDIKALIVSELNLEGRDPATIDDDAPLFGAGGEEAGAGAGGGLGLDSLDALQLAMSIEERFGIRIPEGDEARPIFRSVSSLAAHVASAKALAQP